MRPFESSARRAIGVLVAIVSSLVFTRDASAQGLPNDTYRDIKSVIEDLMTEELAHSIVPSVVCLGGRREVTPPANDAERKAVDARHYPMKIDGKYYAMELIETYPKTLQQIYNRQFSTLKTTVRDESADFAAFTVYKAIAESADAAVKTRETKLAGNAEQNGGGAVDYKPLHQTKTTVLIFSEEVALSTCKDEISAYFDGNVVPSASSPLDTACSSSTAASGSMAEYACNIAFALRALLQEKAALGEEFLIRAVSGIVTDLVLAKAKVAPKDRAALLDVVILAVREFVYKDSITVKDLATKITIGAKAYVTFPGADDAAKIDGVEKTLATIDRLRTQWAVATNVHTAKLDLGAFVETISTTAGYLGDVCKDKDAAALPSCQAREKQQEVLARGAELWSVVRLASRGDYRDVAQKSIGAMFQAAESQKKCDEGNCDKLKLYRRFAESVVAYVLEADESQPRSETTRQAFRAAATDVIRDLGKGGGVDRKGYSGWTILLPDPALRFSWNSAYVNQDGAGYRTIASAEMLKARGAITRTDMMYFAVQLSAIDPLAPLNEVALRKTDVIFDDTSLVAWNVITPRFDLMVGVPALSKHLVAGAGFSLRAVAPFALRDINDPTKVLLYQYRAAFDDDVSLERDWPRFVEFGFALKYLL